MSIAITITDPTPEEARRAADALLALFDAAPAETDTVEPPVYIGNGAGLHPLGEKVIPGVNADPDQIPPDGCYPDPVTSVGLDSAGLPWDGRIHASTRSKTADGSWRLRKGVDDATVASVTAELRGAMAAPAPVVEPPPPVEPPPAPPVGSVEPPPAPPVDTVEPPPAPPPSAMTFPQLMLKITALPPGSETQARVTAAAQKAGLASIGLLGARPDLVPVVAAELGLS